MIDERRYNDRMHLGQTMVIGDSILPSPPKKKQVRYLKDGKYESEI